MVNAKDSIDRAPEAAFLVLLPGCGLVVHASILDDSSLTVTIKLHYAVGAVVHLWRFPKPGQWPAFEVTEYRFDQSTVADDSNVVRYRLLDNLFYRIHATLL